MLKSTEPQGQSRVSERVDFLRGKRVEVRVAYAEIGQIGGETFEAVYVDTVPMGREYFFHFDVGRGLSRLIRTSSVISITEISAQDQ